MTCNKVAYGSRAQALADARQIRQDTFKFGRKKNQRDRYKRLRAYRCPLCERWHLSSKKQKRKY